jgi:hypothetical protein
MLLLYATPQERHEFASAGGLQVTVDGGEAGGKAAFPAGVSLALPSLSIAIAAEQLAGAMLASLTQGTVDLIG